MNVFEKEGKSFKMREKINEQKIVFLNTRDKLKKNYC
jgi:hypothetical protein